MSTPARVVVVGGGILGAATARRLLEVLPAAHVTLLEKEDGLAAHQTGRNSGVVHAGLYYEPGSLKATLCRRGVGLLRGFCAERGLRYDEIGKVLVALDEEDRARLTAIAERARANGVPGIRVLDRAELVEREPHVTGSAALLSPTTAIVDYAAVTHELAADAVARGATVRTGFEVTGIDRRPSERWCSAARPVRRSSPISWWCARACTSTGSPHWPVTRRRRASCRSAASTTR